jgi:hypothetical protein
MALTISHISAIPQQTSRLATSVSPPSSTFLSWLSPMHFTALQADKDSRQRRSSSGGLNKFFQDVKQSETREKIVAESRNFANKIGNQLKSVKDKAAAAVATSAKPKEPNNVSPLPSVLCSFSLPSLSLCPAGATSQQQQRFEERNPRIFSSSC